MDNFKCYKIHSSIKPKLKDELINMLKNMFKLFSEQVIFGHIVQLIIWGIFENIKLELQKDCVKCGQFKVTLECTWDFVNSFFNWSYQVAIIVLGKLPPTWEQEGTTMAHTIAYLVKMYNILTCLVVNTIQIEVHLVTIRRCWTWETKWNKYVQVLGIENKRQITIVVSSSMNGSLLPL